MSGERLTERFVACPVACPYCAVSQIDCRRSLWNERTILGINKAVTFINPSPFEEERSGFYAFNVNLLRGDIVCFNAISDPFWDRYKQELRYFLDRIAPVSRLATCVTKMPIPKDVWPVLADLPNFRLIVSITGLGRMEKTTVKSRLRTLERARQLGILAFPLVHPYISGMSDLSFLKDLRSMGYGEVDVKGLRYNPRMNAWMRPESAALYAGTDERETLPEDGWREAVERAGLTKVSLKDWYRKGVPAPLVGREQASVMVDRIMQMANVCSSDTVQAVRKAAVERRII